MYCYKRDFVKVVYHTVCTRIQEKRRKIHSGFEQHERCEIRIGAKLSYYPLGQGTFKCNGLSVCM